MLKQWYRFLSPKFQNLFLEYKVDFKPRYGYDTPPHPALYEIINTNRNQYKTFLNKALSYKEYIWKIPYSTNQANSSQIVWNNKFLPGLDIVAIYTMLAELKPTKYIEIGSGNSTKVAYKTKVEQNLPTKIISIDPKPRAEIDHLADIIYREPFENSTIDIANELNENDILFIDNSHRILPNSDSTVFFLEVLPKLKKGVIVQLHDIYLPYDYPSIMCNRFYSEQYGLAMFLLANPTKFEILLPNYFISEDKELSDIISPMWDSEHLKQVEKHGGSFWFKIN